MQLHLLKNEHKNEKIVIYVDMDGVLASYDVGEKLDFKTLELLEIEDLKNAAQKLENSGLARIDNG